MKKTGIILIVTLGFSLLSLQAEKAQAQIAAADVIKLTVTKVIRAIDLKVQRLQNNTIWLQNAQKVLENQLSKLRLSEISGWSGSQQQLFSGYYDELWKIKAGIAYYQRIKDLTATQVAMVGEYHKAWSLLRQDNHFNAGEISHMEAVYNGILSASLKNLDQLLLIISSDRTQMTDEQRLELINRAGDRLDENYNDLRRFSSENKMLSLQRSRDLGDTQTIKTLYGIN